MGANGIRTESYNNNNWLHNKREGTDSRESTEAAQTRIKNRRPAQCKRGEMLQESPEFLLRLNHTEWGGQPHFSASHGFSKVTEALHSHACKPIPFGTPRTWVLSTVVYGVLTPMTLTQRGAVRYHIISTSSHN